MHNDEVRKTPRKMPRGPGMGPRIAEKPKNFKNAMKRLVKELKDFKAIIIFSLVLAILGATLSILAPDKLSKLTDEISKGLVVNKESMEKLTSDISGNFNEENLKNKIANIITFDFSNKNILDIMNDPSISQEEKLKFGDVIKNFNWVSKESNYDVSMIYKIPQSILKRLLVESTYNDIVITVDDKLQILSLMSDMKDGDFSSIDMSENVQKVLFDDIQINGINVSSNEQYIFLKEISSLKDVQDVNLLYEKIDNMPDSIKNIIKPYMDIDKIKKITMLLVGMYICSAVFTYIESICMTDVANKFAKRLRSRISIKINKLPLKYFDRNSTGDILSRVTNDVDTIAQTMNNSLATLVSSITLFMGTLIMMFYTNVIMAITAIIATVIGFVGMMLILKNSQKYFLAKQVELGKLNGHIEEIYSGLNVVKVYNGKKDADKKFDILNKKVCESNKKSQFLSGIMQPLMGFIGNFGYVCVCIVGAMLTMNDVISFGVIVAFITYVRLFTSPLSQIAQALTSLQSTAAASERVFDFLDEEEMKSQESITDKLDRDKVKGKIEFKNVKFQYDNNDKPTINDFTAVAKPGQKIAIVGPTGAGKTTMVNLLMKFYDINSGEILIDGVPTSKITRENIHSLFTMVLQDTWMFNGTIKENIIYNRENVSDDRVIEVCKEVGIHHFITTLPHGYDSEVSENDSISAGQKQLLTIARGMIEDSPFLILDEATSNVDTRTEELVQIAMDKLTKGKTSFIIAHRLSTIKNADLILVMKDGNIIEQGNHDELMDEKGFYAELYNSQFEL